MTRINGTRSLVTRKELPLRTREELELAYTSSCDDKGIDNSRRISIGRVDDGHRFGHVAVMDAHNASCQRALLSMRLLNLGVLALSRPVPGTRFSRREDREKSMPGRNEPSLEDNGKEKELERTVADEPRVSTHEPPIVKGDPGCFVSRSKDISHLGSRPDHFRKILHMINILFSSNFAIFIS